MAKIDAAVDHTHHHAFALVGLGQPGSLVDEVGPDVDPPHVVQGVASSAHLNFEDGGCFGQQRQRLERHADHDNVADLSTDACA